MNLQLRIPPLLVMTFAGLLGWLIDRVTPSFSSKLQGLVGVAATFGLLGLACSLLGVVAFRRARTTVNPLDPSAASTLVVSGIYRVTRDPMYVGFLFLLLAQLALLANPFALIVAPAFVMYLNRFQIGPEEQGLQRRFGLDYTLYAARTRRWL